MEGDESFERVDMFNYCYVDEDGIDMDDNDTADDIDNDEDEWGNVIECD